MPGSTPLSGSFSLTYHGHSFQESAKTGPISVFATAGTLASEVTNLGTTGEVHVSRSLPTAEGELSWTVTFLSGRGDVPALQPADDGMEGTGSSVRVSTLANGIAPVRGTISLVLSGVPGEVRRRNYHCAMGCASLAAFCCGSHGSRSILFRQKDV